MPNIIHILFKSTIGSHAYGTATETSDLDLRGVFIYPKDLWFSIRPLSDTLEHEGDDVDWELLKFIRLALQGNPNVLECLFSPLITYTHEFFQPLVDNRHQFLSQRLYRTYRGYALAQKKKFEHSAQINWKHAAHCVRLLSAGKYALNNNDLLVHLGTNASEYVGIRAGEMSRDEFLTLYTRLEGALDKAFQETNLPEEPNEAFVQELVNNIYLQFIGEK